MKKGSYVFLFIVVTIVASFVTSSLWDGIGFALSFAIFIVALVFLFFACCGVIAVIAEIKEKQLLEALKMLAAIVGFGFLGYWCINFLVKVLH